MAKPKNDQFYTKPEIAEMCFEHVFEILSDLNLCMDADDLLFYEPSAGTGNFFDLMPHGRRFGIDIDPKFEGIDRKDFFSVVSIDDNIDRVIVVGNPPFGKRGNTAVSFFNHAAYLASTVCFVVPIIFQKYFIHKQLDPSMKFISSLELPRDAFQLEKGKSYSVNTEFQVWTRLGTKFEYGTKDNYKSVPNPHINVFNDMRHHKPMPIAHQDFQMWQYNNTEQALKVFDNDFDFAVPCQGWQDYSRRETDADACEKHKQWILLKTLDPITLKRLKELDYDALAQRCGTSVPGFRKGDLISEYCKHYDK